MNNKFILLFIVVILNVFPTFNSYANEADNTTETEDTTPGYKGETGTEEGKEEGAGATQYASGINFSEILDDIEDNINYCGELFTNLDFEGDLSNLTAKDLFGLETIEYKPYTELEITEMVQTYQNSPDKTDNIDLTEIIESGVTYLVFSTNTDGIITKVIQNKSEVMTELNAMEEELNKIGLTFRDTEESIENIKLAWLTAQDPKELESQLLAEMNIVRSEMENAADLCLVRFVPPSECPQFSKDDLISTFEDTIGFDIPVKDGQLASIDEFLLKINQVSKVACALGSVGGAFPDFPYEIDVNGLTWYSFEGIFAKFPTFDLFFGNIELSLKNLSLQFPSIHPFLDNFNFNLDAINVDFTAFYNAALNLSTELSLLLNQIKLDLNADLGIDFPDANGSTFDYTKYTGVDEPTKSSLDIIKAKEWQGFEFGNKSTLQASAFAWAELRGGENAHSFQAYGFIGSHILDNELALISGYVDARAGYGSQEHKKSTNTDSGTVTSEETTITAEQSFQVKLKVFGENWVDESKGYEQVETIQTSIEWVSPDTNLYNFQYGYTYVFMIGPVPVTIELGAGMSIGYEAQIGANLKQLYAKLVPKADAYAYIEVGVNIVVLEVGAGANLLILNGNLPISGTADLSFNDKFEPTLDMSISADIEYTALQGAVYAYVKYYVPRLGIPPWKKQEKQKNFFTWKGNHSSRRVMSWGVTYGPEGSVTRGDALSVSGPILDAELANEPDLQIKSEKINAYRDDIESRISAFEASMQQATNNIYIPSISLLADTKVTYNENTAKINELKSTLDSLQYSEGPNSMDSDGDGLVDALEDELGSDKYNADTDGDGIDDGTEHNQGTNMFEDDSSVDTDLDGFDNLTEYNAGSHMNNPDITPENMHILYLIPILGLLLG
jgi:hypothetical protein